MLLAASDERLVALARAGDEQAFAAIVERYRAPLLRYCNGFLPPAAAEDALQQTFINAYAALSRESASAPVSLRPWLYRVAHPFHRQFPGWPDRVDAMLRAAETARA